MQRFDDFFAFAENEVVMGLLARCRYGRHQLCDPEGNLLDVLE